MSDKKRDAEFAAVKVAAENLEPSIRAGQEDKLEEFRKELSKDKKEYRFRCQKWGDFLALFIQRGDEPTSENRDWYSNKHCSAINLKDSVEIILTEGRLPDLQGTVTFHEPHRYKNDEPKELVEANEQRPPSRQMMQVEVTGFGSGYCMGDGGRRIPPLNFCARAADDDKIKFSGPGITIFVPHGRGQEIYEIILAALAKS